MGKNKQRSTAKLNIETPKPKLEASVETKAIILQWLYTEREGLLWVIGFALLGSILGFGIGTGHLTGSTNGPVSSWRVALGARIRSTRVYQFSTRVPDLWHPKIRSPELDLNLRENPAHARIFAILREAIVREPGGFVHPDLGFLVPAPSGASRGIGMVKNGWNECQTRCMPGIADEKELKPVLDPTLVSMEDIANYMQEEVLIRVPLSYQMTRQSALKTLTPLIHQDILQQKPLEELDDAALLVLYLSHERGLGRASKWLPYIASLPKEPSCGYNSNMRSQYLDAIAAYSDELNLEVQGWPQEVHAASKYADKISNGLSGDYGSYIKNPPGISAQENLAWALCQVASRATAGSEKYGSLRLLPLLDQINHDATAAGFVELTGKERYHLNDFLETTEQDAGSFVIRSLRHGRRRSLKLGQELTANYNVPHYTPLDWFLSLGFVPPERWSHWVKVDAVLPRVRKDGPFNAEEENNNNEWLKVPQ